MSDIIEIFPGGDVLITVKTPLEEFAPWDPDDGLSLMHGSPLEPVEFLVSATRMIRAIPMMGPMLDGPFVEGAVHSDGLRHIEHEGYYDDVAYMHTLDIIHSNKKLIPRRVDLDLLAKFAEIVHYLDCLNSVHSVANRWMKRLWRKLTPLERLPARINRDLVLWIYISSVFAKMISLTSARSASSTPSPVISLPCVFSGTRPSRIEAERDVRRNEVMGVLHKKIDQLSAGRGGHCKLESCSVMLLGTSIKTMRTIHLPLTPGQVVLADIETILDEIGYEAKVPVLYELVTQTVDVAAEDDRDEEEEDEGTEEEDEGEEKGEDEDMEEDGGMEEEYEEEEKEKREEIRVHACSLSMLLKPELDKQYRAINGLELDDILPLN